MYLIVGLGNPGKQYQKTRHNIGFEVISDFQCRLSDSAGWKLNKKFQAEISEIKNGSEKILLLKPQTFMNNSGQAVKAVTKFYKIKPENILIIHDDKDITFGEIKIQIGRGDAGHNGIKSIIQHLGTKDFIRLRIGLKPNRACKKEIADFVLGKFTPNEQKLLPKVIQKASEAIKMIIKEGVERAMNKFNV